MSPLSQLLSRLSSAALRAGHGRSRLARAVPLLLVLAVLLSVSGHAHAAVPMCSSDGRSIAAPPILLPGRGLVLDTPRPCPQPTESLLVRSLPHDPGGQPTAPVQSPLRAVPVFAAAQPRPYAGRTLIEATQRPVGFDATRGVYRPPRA